MKGLPKIITLKEHEELKLKGLKDCQIEELKSFLNENGKDGGNKPQHLGIGVNFNCLSASYYIGADWLDKDHAVVVTPKIENLDFVEMFVCALGCEPASKYFSDCYNFDFDCEPIQTNVFKKQLTPLIIVLFLDVLKKIIKRGLKKSYVIRTENLQSKIKGKIKISQHIKKNIILQREDRVFCQYQEYTVDNLENRLLKKALNFAGMYVRNNLNKHSPSLISTLNKLSPYFIDVSEEIELHELKSACNSGFYKEYTEGIRLAKMILRMFGFAISATKTESDITPPFWIDMPRLYEVYVYSKLFEKYGERIQFQVEGYRGTTVDFVDVENKLIIDTKYKPRYDDGNKYILDDIRQISAYARDKNILKTLGYKDGYCHGLIRCLIIYPEKVIVSDKDKDGNVLPDDCPEFDNSQELISQAQPINGFNEFYKLRCRMPREQ